MLRKVTEALREKNALFTSLYDVPAMDPQEVHGNLISLAPADSALPGRHQRCSGGRRERRPQGAVRGRAGE